MPDIVCQLNGAEFTAALFNVIDDVDFAILQPLNVSINPKIALQKCQNDIREQITRSHDSVSVVRTTVTSQWGMAKFDPQPTLNPQTDRHQI